MHDMNFEDEEEAMRMEDEAAMWRGVTDESSGKTYYYHIITRESVWDKPLCLCSAKERAEVAWREEQQRIFFSEMEGNIRRKIQQGKFFADGTGGTPPQNPSATSEEKCGENLDASGQAPLKSTTVSLCRTISAMDESAVAELNAAISPISTHYVKDLELTLSPYHVVCGNNGGSPVGFPNAPTPTSIATCPPVLHALGRGRGGGFSRTTDNTTDKNISNSKGICTNDVRSGRAPAHDGGLSAAATHPASAPLAAPPHCATSPPHVGASPFASSVNNGSGGLCSGLSAAGELAGGADGPPVAASVSRRRIGSGAHGGGAHRLFPPHLTRRNSTSTIYLAPHDTLSDPDLDAAIRCVCAVFRAHMIEAVADEGAGGSGGGHARGNGRGRSVDDAAGVSPTGYSGGTDGDDVFDLGSAGSSGAVQWAGLREGSWQGDDVSVFDDPPPAEAEDDAHDHDDMPELGQLRRYNGDHGGGRLGKNGTGAAAADADAGAGTSAAANPPRKPEVPGGGTGAAEIPLLREITAYYRDLYHRTKLKFDCIVLSLIYVERLMKETRGALRPRPSNWKSLLMSVLVLSSKVWDDNSMWNRDFSELCPSFTLARLNQLEVAVLEVLRYNVKVLSSEYAKYYFHLRSMCVRGGLSEGHAPMHPLDMEDVRVLEDLSSRLAIRSVGQMNRSRKATTLHSFHDARLLQKVAKGYKFTDKQAPSASLEQVVHKMRP